MTQEWHVGDRVVYCVTKWSTGPGRRARQIHPAKHGEQYQYQVEKFWRIWGTLPNGDLQLVTRTGKFHTVRPGDPCMRHANLWDLLWHRQRFPSLEDLKQQGINPPGSTQQVPQNQLVHS